MRRHVMITMRWKLLATALALSSGAVLSSVPSRAAVDVLVLESNESRLRVRIDLTEARLEPIEVEGRLYQRILLPGLLSGGAPGMPSLPTLGKWVLLPPVGDARLSVRIVERRDLGRARVIPCPVPVRPDAGDGDGTIAERIEEAPAYATFRTEEARVATLGAPVWARHQRMAPLTIRPAFYDAGSERVQVATAIELEIAFTGGESITTSEPVSPDAVVLRTVLNPEVAARWRGLSPAQREHRDRWTENARRSRATGARRKAQGVQPLDPSNFLSDEVRVRISRTQLWRVAMADLIDEQGFPTDVRRRDVRLYQKRASSMDSAWYPTPVAADVPFLFVGAPDPDGLVSRDDILVFYGFRPEDDASARLVDGDVFGEVMRERPDNFNTDNVYWIVADSTQSWARLPSTTLGPATGTPRASFRRTDRFDGDTGYQPNALTVDEPRYHWNESDETTVLRQLELTHPLPTSSIGITWTMVRFVQDLNPMIIRASVRQTGRPSYSFADENIGGASFVTLQPITETIPAGTFDDGFISLSLVHYQDGIPAFFISAFLGSVTLEYDAFYRANSLTHQARFDTGQRGGDVDLQVDGFSDSNLLLFELTDPRRPTVVALTGDNFVAGGTALSLHVPQTPFQQRSFQATPLARIERVPTSHLERDRVFDVVEATGPAQALAIGPAEFADATEPWLQWRRDNDLYGWDYAYVDVQQIYDQFSGGLKSPSAIKAFAYIAYTAWDARALLLVGDANENARGLGRSPAPDVVPSSLHVQNIDEPELLASDKWYGLFCDDPGGEPWCQGYPSTLTKGPDMVVGRLPANDVSQLTGMIDKIIAYEHPSASDDWRDRTLWIADDAWSTDYFGGFTENCYRMRTEEEGFEDGQATNADIASGSLDGTVTGEVFSLDANILPEWRIPVQCADGHEGAQRSGVIQQVAQFVAPRFNDVLSQGWLWVSYQGHAAYNVFAHEALFAWERIQNVRNDGRPFIFFGMGCHIADFLQATEGSKTTSIGEELVKVPVRGAVATYGSSGFEFLEPNRVFMELITRNFFEGSENPRQPITSDPLQSLWILGESLAQSEMEILTLDVDDKATMMAQYNLLGDPLLRVDAAPPRLTASTDAGPLQDGARIEAPPDSTTLPMAFTVIDHSGIHGIEVEDSAGRDYSSLVQFENPDDPRRRQATLDLPIHPQAYEVSVRAFDGSYPHTRPSVLHLSVPFEMIVRVDGVPIAEGTGNLEVGTTAAVEVDFTSAVAVAENEIEVSMDGAEISPHQSTALDQDGRRWRVSFDIQSVSGEDQAIHLVLAGNDNTFVLAVSVRPELGLSQLAAFPNPSRGPVRFVGRATRPVDWAKLTIFDLTGRAVHDLRATVGGLEDFIVPWDGRDGRGDELGNGVYLYRLEVGDAFGSARSELGRLVFMR